MLSIEECKKYLNDSDLTDEELKKIRDDLYELASLALDDYFKHKNVLNNKF